jgi:riboflavin kinase/FMN adenylyltransferase
MGFTAIAVPPVLLDGDRISSTMVRLAVQAGDFDGCAQMLGRPHTVFGTVVRGRQLGRKLGFPTANLHVHNEQLPPLGVYAARVDLDGTLHDAVANLGMRPTIESDGQPLLEVHLLDFNGDIYGRHMEVRFIKHLRAERTFEGVGALREQIARDAIMAREVLA